MGRISGIHASVPRPGLGRRLRLFGRSFSQGLRRNSRWAFGRAVAGLVGPRKAAGELVASQISTVLVCRINGRMGNTVFLTPLVRRIHDLIPHATIDLALAYPYAGELMQTMPGLRRVIAFPHKGPQLVRRYWAALRALRRERYDVAIDPVPESTSGRIVMALCHSRYRLGFATGSQWAPLTHTVPEPIEIMHQALSPVFLLSRALGTPYDPRSLTLSLFLQAEELQRGRDAISQALAAKSLPPQALERTFGFFAHATAHKTIERSWWSAFWAAFLELQPDAIPVEFLPSPQTPPTDARFASLHIPSPRALTAAIAATHLFISADTGPMHLASSTDVPTIALFRASNPTLYGPLKPSDLVLNLAELTPQQIARRCHERWNERAAVAVN